MATPKGASVPTKLSFAKIAAMPAPYTSSSSTSKKPQDTKARSSEKTSNAHTSTLSGPHLDSNNLDSNPSHSTLTQVDDVTPNIEGLSLLNNPTKPLQRPGGESSESAEDDQSHLSSSSLKQQSFETKSMASVTTFAMDEKESIRPDDSASVRAVEDDERSTLSRSSTFQHAEAPSQMNRSAYRGMTITARRFPTITLANPPRFGDLPMESVQSQDDMPPPAIDQGSDISDVAQGSRHADLLIAPDEKLLEALATPKDRLPLLQLEEKILEFLQSKTDMIELPPQNSFARLLSHKLADYYNLAHHANEDNSSVRIFRTPCCSLPTSLATLATSIPIGNAQISGITAVRIMRRAGLDPRLMSAGGSTAPSSSIPSKATSEAGAETNSEEGLDSSLDGTPSRDKSKMSREEREAQYKAARERIFGDFQESIPSEGASTGEHSTSMSRSSSSSGRRKAKGRKAPKDDSFEARSAFIPSYTSISMSAMQPQFQNPYADQQYHNAYSQPIGNFMPNVDYGSTPTQSFPGFDGNAGYGSPMAYGVQPYGAAQGWNGMQSAHQPAYSNYSQGSNDYHSQASSIGSQTTAHYGQQSTFPIQQPHHGWMNNQYQNSYPSTPTLSTQGLTGWPGFNASQNGTHVAPHPYGPQYPHSYDNTSFQAQHQSSGDQARSLFNPQTRSFVPSASSERLGGKGNRKKTTNNKNGNGGPKHELTGAASSVFSPRGMNGNMMPSRPKEESLMEKYGTPANLPKKPPLPRVSGTADQPESHINGPVVVNGNSA